jgi:thiol:disulfide interchange protein DsbD
MFVLGLIGGFIALVTPCVWPIIPFTLSFFLKRTGDRRKNLRDAFLYGISIIVIYVGIGLLITIAYGASALNSLSTSAVFNLFFFALLLVFAVSFLGAFELTLPSSWSSKVDAQAESSQGIWGIFLMAFTLALVSFSCTGPIIGTLLVTVSVEGSYLAPTIGMLGFAVALSLPFTLTAMFPNFLKTLPKSGSWMNTVKVTMGFLELALALKFFSVADLAYGWGILDREVFLALWIVIFTLLGLYLAGIILLSQDKTRQVGAVRLLFAIASLSFAVYLLPGLWGAPLKATSAFAPPLYTQDFNLNENEVHPQFTDYEQGLAFAKQENKPVLLNFTGHGCVNCRKMEASIWTAPAVSQRMNNDFVLVSLFVDDKTDLPEPIEITENGQTRLLKTLGDKWSYLQRNRFNNNSQPFYIILDSDGNPLSKSITYTSDVKEFLAFLKMK